MSLVMRGHFGAVLRILPDLVAQRAHGHAEYARCMCTVAATARERLQDKFSFDFLDGGADQETNHALRRNGGTSCRQRPSDVICRVLGHRTLHHSASAKDADC